MKNLATRKLFFYLHVTGVLLAAFSLIVKQLYGNKEACIILWIVSLMLIAPYLIYKQQKQENLTSKDWWPYALLGVVLIIYLIINNK